MIGLVFVCVSMCMHVVCCLCFFVRFVFVCVLCECVSVRV